MPIPGWDEEGVRVAAAFLRRLQPSQRPASVPKLGVDLRHKGCCRVRVDQHVTPAELLQAMLPCLTESKATACWYQSAFAPFVAAVKVKESSTSTNNSSEQARAAATKALLCIRSMSGKLGGPQAVSAWMCSQAYGMHISDSAALVAELQSRGLIACNASSAQVTYNEKKLSEVPDPAVRQPWNADNWLVEDFLDSEKVRDAFTASLQEEDAKSVMKSANKFRVQCWPLFCHSGDEVKRLTALLGWTLKTHIDSAEITVFSTNGRPTLTRDELRRLLPFFIGPAPAFQCNTLIGASNRKHIIGKDGQKAKSIGSASNLRFSLQLVEQTEEENDASIVEHTEQKNADNKNFYGQGADDEDDEEGYEVLKRKQQQRKSRAMYRAVGWLSAAQLQEVIQQVTPGSSSVTSSNVSSVIANLGVQVGKAAERLDSTIIHALSVASSCASVASQHQRKQTNIDAEADGIKGHYQPHAIPNVKLNRTFSSEYDATKNAREYDRASNVQKNKDRKAGKEAKEERRKHDYLKSVDKGNARRGGRHKAGDKGNVAGVDGEDDYGNVGKDAPEDDYGNVGNEVTESVGGE